MAYRSWETRSPLVAVHLPLIAERISVRHLIKQAGWNFRFCIYVCTLLPSIMFQECWLRCNVHARLLRLPQSRTMRPPDRRSQTSGQPYAMQRSKWRTYYCELYLSDQTDSSEPVGFPQRGAWSRLSRPFNHSNCADIDNCWSLQLLLHWEQWPHLCARHLSMRIPSISLEWRIAVITN